MTLTIDIGNTSAKWAIFRTGDIVHSERLSDAWQDTLSRITLDFGVPRRVLISNVAGPQPELVEALHAWEQLAVKVQWLTWQSAEASRWVSDIPMGLGADRLAADAGARQLENDATLLVVDAGTCLTFDVIAKDGRILGGSISPGIELRLKAMHDHTAALPLLRPEGEAPVVGYDLMTAMRGGCLNGLRWEIEGYVRHLVSEGYSDLRVFYTGGNDLQLAPDVEARLIHDPLLVMRGLMAIYAA